VPSARKRSRKGLSDDPFTSPSYTGQKAALHPCGPRRNGLRPLIRLWGPPGRAALMKRSDRP
jgi:hypothetical protein